MKYQDVGRLLEDILMGLGTMSDLWLLRNTDVASMRGPDKRTLLHGVVEDAINLATAGDEYPVDETNELVDYLIDRGVDINAETTKGETAMNFAEKRAQYVFPLLTHLAKKGAAPPTFLGYQTSEYASESVPPLPEMAPPATSSQPASRVTTGIAQHKATGQSAVFPGLRGVGRRTTRRLRKRNRKSRKWKSSGIRTRF